MDDLITTTPQGLYCPAGDFYIDPWAGVERAVLTHAHSDHARVGSREYLCARPGLELVRLRLGPDAAVGGLEYGQAIRLGAVQVSLHPAGHMLGSAQVRIERAGRVAVVSGDYKRQAEPTSATFVTLECQEFVTEATFALPIYRWPSPVETFEEINAWWRGNQAAGRTSVLYGYALGKAQRLLAGIDAGIGPLFAHGAVRRYLPAYAEAGVSLPEVRPVVAEEVRESRGAGLVLATPLALNSPWQRKLGPVSTAFASGWMRLRGPRRRRNLDRGFVLSDHADWADLVATIRATGAERILVTHGYTAPFARYLQENGWNASVLATEFGDESEGGMGPGGDETVEEG